MDDYIDRQAAIDDLHGKDPSQIWDTADVEVWINALPPAQPEWISWDGVRFPEESGCYIVTAHDGSGSRVTFAKYQKRLKRWELTGARAYWRVLAWQPLPKPWEGEQDG